MPLSDGYGVLIGHIEKYYRDDPDDFGRYYHGSLEISAPLGTYRCAIDVDSKHLTIGVEWRIVPLRAAELMPILSLGTGYHRLSSTAASGAMDYVRRSIFAPLAGIRRFSRNISEENRAVVAWKRGRSIDALAELEPLVTHAKTEGLLVLVFGEPFSSGFGMHNIHQNQGDPPGSQWWAENGIWQDGSTLLQLSQSEYVAFANKFTSQAYVTDAAGHPA